MPRIKRKYNRTHALTHAHNIASYEAHFSPLSTPGKTTPRNWGLPASWGTVASPPRASQYYGIEGFKGGPQSGLHYAERRCHVEQAR